MTGTVVIAGSLAQRPGVGGHTWVFLQYLLGFRRLGWDVLFIDRLEPEMCVDAAGEPCPVDRSLNLRYFLDVMKRFDLDCCFALSCDGGKRWLGLSRGQVLERARRSDVLFNVMGFLTDEAVLDAARLRVFLDIDPGFGQMWRALGLHDPFAGHNEFVTIGQNIGQDDCGIPTCGLTWITTPQPVVLDLWPPCPASRRRRFTSVVTWRGAFGPLEYRGKTYGLRVHEFRKFVELPRESGQVFELALDIHRDEVKDLALLTGNGWSLVDPSIVAGDPCTYRAYIQDSGAELMVAKNMYVETASGWFSDRSICYLASGKPVLAQDTGLAQRYPVGIGLLTFVTLEDARAGVAEIAGNYDRHAAAARELAESHFDSNKVLPRLLGALRVA
ncbi:MAG: hypothetical protein ACR2JC_07660 [Chloroflexota bacterium]|nr:MAG: hypothetical protein DLM70_11925 [Chloroflexota bacterium]